jgi:hypothetical protein
MKKFLILVLILSLSGCVASSKHVKQLDKIVEAQAEQIDQIITVINAKGLLTIEQADSMTKNSTIILNASHDQVKETASIFTWKIFTWEGFKLALTVAGKVAKDFVAGNYIGIASTAVTALAGWYIKNKAVKANDEYHTEDKVKLVAKVLTGEESTSKYNECKETACKIVEKHEA